MKVYKQKLKEIIKKELGDIDIAFSIPPNSKLGDLALPCFPFAKALKKNPIEIANVLKESLTEEKYIEKIEVKGGFLNIFFNKAMYIEEVINNIKTKKNTYGSGFTGKGENALIEHTSINPNASPHIGRARNALIGDTAVRLLKFEGYNVDTHYFVNDVGKQIAMLVLGAKDNDDITFADLLNVYVDINSKVKENPQLEKEVFDLLYAFENGDEDVQKQFRKIVNICIDGQTNILAKLGIKYDNFQYESDYIFNNRTNEVLQQLQKTGKLFEDAEGRLVLDENGYNLPVKEPVFVLTRKDKTSLYPLRDLAYTIDKLSMNNKNNIIVLGEDQKTYHKQLSAALDILGYDSPASVHYSFVLLTEGKMSTRNGAVVLLEDFMKEAVERVKKRMIENNKKVDEYIAESIAYGAVKYAILKVDKEKNVTFNWESALNFEGDSGPYLQYSYARINSIIKKYGKELPSSAHLSLLKTEVEYELVKELGNFENVVKKAIKEFSPNVIANYIYSVTKKFSSFYHECNVLNADSEELKKARLILISSVKTVLSNAFSLLGIETVDYM